MRSCRAFLCSSFECGDEHTEESDGCLYSPLLAKPTHVCRRLHDGRMRTDDSARVPGVKAYAFSFTVRSFFTDFTPGTCQTVQDAWALVIRLDTSPLSDTTPALVSAWIPATLRA